MKLRNYIFPIILALGFVIACSESDLKKAQIFEKQGEWEKAQEILEQSAKKNPDDPRVQNELGYVLEKRGFFEQAYRRYSLATSLDPHYWEAFYNRGTLSFKLAKYKEAKKDFEKVISLNVTNARAYNNLGLVEQVFFDDAKKAAKHIKKAIELEPENPEFHNSLAEVYERIGKRKLAREEKERAQILRASRSR